MARKLWSPALVSFLTANRSFQVLGRHAEDPTHARDRPICGHLDLRPREGSGDEELARLLAHGATEVLGTRGDWGPGTGWVVLADPEGNELCILRSEAEVNG